MVNVLPRYNEAVIPIKKFVEYALNPEKDPNKALAFFLALGYNISSADKLVQNIRDNIANFECREKNDLGHGAIYEVCMVLLGENGKTANVLTAWIDDKATGEMRLINAYVKKRKGGK